jgi:hypothetical protein
LNSYASQLKDDESQSEHLVVLVGKNPLPNLVAVLALLRNPKLAQLLLVYSAYTYDQCVMLEKVLLDSGFEKQQFVHISVEEANPDSIYNQVTSHVQGLNGQIKLNYTGGTKAMAVHAYRVLEALVATGTIGPVQFSYLDARSLTMQVIEPNGDQRRFDVGLACQISLEEILNLHSRKASLKEAPLWPRTAHALSTIQQDQAGRAAWKQWAAQTFLAEPEWPAFTEVDPSARDEAWRAWARRELLWKGESGRKWKPNSAIRFEVPERFAVVFQTLREEVGFDGPVTVEALKAHGGFKRTGDCGKWFEGEWLETYVLDQVLALKNQPGNPLHIGDAARDIQAEGPQQVQADVAFMRGYQLFVLSCTTSKSLAKSKLLEAVVRAEQLGGAEARVALVCSDEIPGSLKGQVEDLLATKVEVFGVHQLPSLRDELARWVDAAS